MLTNLLSLVVLTLAVYIIVKIELTNILNWIHKDRTDTKEYLVEVYDFWKEVLKSKVRAVAMIIVLICQRGVIEMVISIAILIGVSYYLIANNSILESIPWYDDNTQDVVTGIIVSMSVLLLMERLGLAEILIKSVVTLGCIIAICIILYLLNEKFKGFKK